ncbi:hypothetical protein [Actinomadura atramentaria]|uniref:hypothetical protein n=1 Tax=Actinomadura atramentaria TaxID=1990 RepID=UPI000375800A|nr:hypothetical protein [Actinomadura atramentaria]
MDGGIRVGTAAAGGTLVLCAAALLGADAVEAVLAGVRAGAHGTRAAADPVLAPSVVRYAARHGWFWPAVAGVAELVALAGAVGALRTVRAAVLRRRNALDGPSRMLVRAAAIDLRRDVLAVPGVRDLRFALTGTRRAPRLALTVACPADAPLGALLAALGDGPVERFRRAADLPALAAVVRFRPGAAALRRGFVARRRVGEPPHMDIQHREDRCE